MIVYDPFWNTIKKMGISQYKLVNEYGFSNGTLDSLRKNRPVNTTTINQICKKLNIRVEQVIEYIDDR